ncbi:MAG: L-glutamate gamma-semialdehyde dehydrogenase [Deltaproteobacteria bacterium]|nr:L-glutamate gamma-semialdehyde dehydrogenase [Deltaproteobacteria bacterium]
MEDPSGREKEISELARSLYKKAAEQKPSLFDPQDWMGRMIDWSLKDEDLRVALFRFVDVLPSLDSAAEIGRHLREYFGRVDHALSGLVYLAQTLHAGWLVAPVVRQNVVRLARRFIVEQDTESLVTVLSGLRKEPSAFTLDVVGETTLSDPEADAMQGRYIDLTRRLAPEVEKWPVIPQIDSGWQGPLPKVNVSVKLSSLCPRFDPLDPNSSTIVKGRLRSIFREGARLGASLTIDMEKYAYKDLTLSIFRELLEEDEFKDKPQLAIAFQVYLLDSDKDLNDLLRWASARGRRIGIRLVKGAYWDSEIAWAKQKGWPVPVFLNKDETDANFERATRLVFEHRDVIDLAFGSHNIRSIAHGIVTARELGIPDNGYEMQMLYGMAEPIRQAIVQSGFRVRVYVPVGELIPGMSYLIRRLMENTSNASFLRQTFAEERDLETLIRPPSTKGGATVGAHVSITMTDAESPSAFENDPLLDFSRSEVRSRYAETLKTVKGRLGGFFPLWVAGKELKTEEVLISVNPANPKETVGKVPVANMGLADEAIRAAQESFAQWQFTSPKDRASVLFRAASIMRRQRMELAAWEAYEAGKGWREADADVVEAIDYLEFYGREMLRLSEPQVTQRIPGESNLHFYRARGVAAVIAPWNFPLAIPTGMTTAALVTGNCVVLKPAEQAPVLGAHLMNILREAGVPSGACQLVQGGGDLGAYLVRHPEVNLIAFTGSKDVGLEILREASQLQPGQQEVKRVVCEMGGKNAIIVDEDADLDEAVAYTIESAFGYQGQKCSAASRLILLEEVHDRVVERLVEAVKCLRVGPADDPASALGPLIDEAAFQRVREYINLGKKEGNCVIQLDGPSGGYYVGPTIFTGIEPKHRLAQEEIFGPVLSVMKAKDFDHALEIANGTSFALTGGVFSRSPSHIDKARDQFRVGNLYINRGITGAIVQRQPFGGLKLSGIGSKAGGPDYLLQFLEPRAVSENTLRRGFVPPKDLKD